MSLFFNVLSRFVIVFLPRSKYLNFMTIVTIRSDFGTPQKWNLSLLPLFPLLFAMKCWDWVPQFSFYECWILSQLFHSSFMLKKLFSSSSLSAIRLALSAYLRLLILLLATLNPACASSSQAFCMMYFAYQLNKWGNKIQPLRTPFSVWTNLLFYVWF